MNDLIGYVAASLTTLSFLPRPCTPSARAM